MDDFEFYELKQQKMENNNDTGDKQKEEKLNEKIRPVSEDASYGYDKISRKHSDSVDDVEKYFSNINLNQEYGIGKC